MAGPYLGDFVEDATVHFIWDSNNGDGASITRSTDGTVSVYKDNGVTQSVAGVTDTEDFDSLTGIHVCTIDTSADAFYAIGSNYSVVLSAATIDGQTVNAVLAHFSIENRFTDVQAISGDKTAADNFETMLDGTGGQTLSLGQLNIVASGGNSAIVATGDGAGHGIIATGGATNADGINASGGGTGAGIYAEGGATGDGIEALGGATSGDGMNASAQTSGNGFLMLGVGTGAGINTTGGATDGIGIRAQAGGTNGTGMQAAGAGTGLGLNLTSSTGAALSAVGGTGIIATGASGHGIAASGGGANSGISTTGGATGHGVLATGGATSGDGIQAVAATLGDGIQATGVGGGFDINADIQGTVSGDVNVGSMSANTVTASALATDAVNEIRDSILSDSTSFAGANIDAAITSRSSHTAAGAADAVWDEARAGHVTAGTFGEGVASVQGAVTGSVDDVTNAVSVDSLAANTVTASALATDAVNEIRDAILSDSTAFAGANIDAAITSRSSHTAANVLDEAIAEPSGIFTWPASIRTILQWVGVTSRNRLTQTSTTTTVRNDANSADLATSSVLDDGTTFVRGEFS